MFCGTGLRYRRFHQTACILLRGGRHETYLRNGIPLRTDRLWFLPGSDRTADEGRDRLCHGAGGDHFPRSQRLYFHEAGGYGFYLCACSRCERNEDRYSQRLFRRRAGSRGQGCGTGSSGSIESTGGRSGGVRLKSGRLCDPHLLYDRGCRGKFQSRAFRWRKIWLPCPGCGGSAHHVQEKPFAGLWPRGKASYHAGILCIKLRLL